MTAKEIVRAKFEESYAAPADEDVVMLLPASTEEVLFFWKSRILILIYP